MKFNNTQAIRYIEAEVEATKERDEIRQYNVGGESLSEDDLARIEQIANRTYVHPEGKTVKLLDEEELQNLQIGRGTLTIREREIINNHISVTIKMLEQLPFTGIVSTISVFLMSSEFSNKRISECCL